MIEALLCMLTLWAFFAVLWVLGDALSTPKDTMTVAELGRRWEELDDA